jgi:hypothetical protein
LKSSIATAWGAGRQSEARAGGQRTVNAHERYHADTDAHKRDTEDDKKKTRGDRKSQVLMRTCNVVTLKSYTCGALPPPPAPPYVPRTLAVPSECTHCMGGHEGSPRCTCGAENRTPGRKWAHLQLAVGCDGRVVCLETRLTVLHRQVRTHRTRGGIGAGAAGQVRTSCRTCMYVGRTSVMAGKDGHQPIVRTCRGRTSEGKVSGWSSSDG